MPLLETRQLDAHTLLGIWALTEPLEVLLEALPPHLILNGDLQAAHPKRQREWLASRLLVYRLLRHFTPEPLPLHRNTHGRPVFDAAGLHVSISHSPALAAVILSDKYEVGIDVELLTPKALRVAEKFLTAEEKVYAATDEAAACLYWSAKETLYKMYSKRKLIFKENLLISPANVPENKFLQGCVKINNFSKLYRVSYETLPNHVLTYCIDKL